MSEILAFLYSDPFWQGLIFLSAFLAVFLLMLAVWPDTHQAAIRRRLGVFEDVRVPTRVPLFRWFRPFYLLLVPTVAARDLSKQRTKLGRRLLTANLQEDISPDEFIALKWVTTLVVPLLIVYLSNAFGLSWPLVTWPFLLGFGYFFPDLWLRERTRLRRRQIIRALPYTLDLLTLSVEAGLDFIASIQRLTQRSRPNALLAEFQQMLKEIRLGTTRADALRNLSDRLQIEEISSFTTLLIQADQLGASIGQVLRAQSDHLRASRFQAAEAAGAKASQQVLIPLVLLIFPAVFIVLIGPMLLGLLQKGIF